MLGKRNFAKPPAMISPKEIEVLMGPYAVPEYTVPAPSAAAQRGEAETSGAYELAPVPSFSSTAATADAMRAADLQQQLTAALKQLADKKTEIASLQNQVDFLRKKLQESKTQQAQGASSEAAAQIQQLEQQLQDMATKFTQSQEVATQIGTVAQGLQQQLNTATLEKETIQAQLSQVQNTLSSAGVDAATKALLQQKEDDIVQLRQLIANQSQQINTLEEKFESVSTKKDDEATLNANLRNQVTDLEEANAKLKAELAAASTAGAKIQETPGTPKSSPAALGKASLAAEPEIESVTLDKFHTVISELLSTATLTKDDLLLLISVMGKWVPAMNDRTEAELRDTLSNLLKPVEYRQLGILPNYDGFEWKTGGGDYSKFAKLVGITPPTRRNTANWQNAIDTYFEVNRLE
jgi:uncharacterized phage infection (PIP) family protein YhgE